MSRNRNKCGIMAIPLAALAVSLCTGMPSYGAEADDGGKLNISLQQCQEMAQEHNPYVLNAQLDIWAAQAQKREAVAEYFPKVSVNALAFQAFDPLLEIGVKDIFGDNDFSNNLDNLLTNLGWQMGFDPEYSTLRHGVTATVSAIQPVFAGGRMVNGNRLQALGRAAGWITQEIKPRTTSDDGAKGYWTVVAT